MDRSKGWLGIRFPDAELSSRMDVGKQLKVQLGMRKRLVSERQWRWHQERVGLRAGGRGLEENGDARKCPGAGLNDQGRTAAAPNHRAAMVVSRGGSGSSTDRSPAHDLEVKWKETVSAELLQI
jgi:hypothetical protein